MPFDAHHQVNRLRAILAGIDHAIVRIKNQQPLLLEVCRVAVEVGGFKLAWVGMVEPEGSVKPVAQAGLSGYLENINQITVRDDVPEGRGVVGTAIRENRPVVVENILTDASMVPWRERAQKFGLNYIAAFPIHISGEVAGSFVVYAPQAELFDASEMELLTQMSHDLSLALTAMSDLAARQQAEQALQISEERYRMLLEDQTDAISRFGVDGTITFVNGVYCQLFGRSKPELLGSKWQPRAVAEDLPVIEARLKMLSPAHPVVVIENRVFDGAGQVRWFQFVNRGFFDAPGTMTEILSVGRDVTESKNLDLKMQELAAIVQGSDDAIFSATPEGIIVSWNQGAENLMGYAAAEAIGQSVLMLVPPEENESVSKKIQIAGQNGKLESFDARRRRKDGTLRDVSVRISQVTDEAGKVTRLTAIYRDISARKQLEQTVLKISAEERRRVGHELHDGLGQFLAGISFKVKVLEEDLTAGESPLSKQAAQLVELLNNAIKQTRSLAHGLAPVDFEVCGLPAALQNLAAQTEEMFRVACEYKCLCGPDCPLERVSLGATINNALYRIAQEAINNAVTHGKARRIEISLKADLPQVILTVRDNGHGFDNNGQARMGMGLRIMSYRADSTGGRLSVYSEPGLGTEIKCSLSAATVSDRERFYK